MITIKREENEAIIKQFIADEKITVPVENVILMTACENETILAQGALVLKNNRIVLDHLVLSDEFKNSLELALGLLKSLLNLADLRNMKEIYGYNPAMRDYYKMLRFTETTENDTTIYYLSLEGYFYSEHEKKVDFNKPDA